MANPLTKIITDHIRTHGPLDLGTYMRLCLAHPDHGYYLTRGASAIGQAGDFTTAPEISQLFGEMIGFWIADLWGQMQKPNIILAELGPGKGTLMADALRILARIPGFIQHTQIHLVEISDHMIAHQAQALQGYDITWHDHVDDLPTDMPLIIINNEFFDALPVRQFARNDRGAWDEIVVGLNTDQSLTMGRVPAGRLFLTDQDFLEISPDRDAAAQILYGRLQKQSGAILTIDYGYDTPPGTSTLQAVQSHQPVNVLHEPGQCDLTALVDFSRLATLARDAGLKVAGPVGQGAFLKSLGIDDRLRHIIKTVEHAPRDDLYAGLHRLTAHDQMGTLFKVLCAYQGAMRPEGFKVSS